MIAYVTVGSDDIARAKRFYAAFLPALDYRLKEGPEGLSYALPEQPGQPAALPDFYVKPTFDGRPASAGNGAMVAFEARSQKQVARFTPPRLPLVVLTKGSRAFVPRMDPIFMWATCVIPKATRSHYSRAILMNPGGTDNQITIYFATLATVLNQAFAPQPPLCKH